MWYISTKKRKDDTIFEEEGQDDMQPATFITLTAQMKAVMMSTFDIDNIEIY